MAIYLATLVAMLNQISFSGSRVAVSLYALELGANQLAVGIMIAFYSLFPMLLAITIGRLVDRVGARLPIMIGTAVMAVVLLLPLAMASLPALFVLSILIGLFHSLFTLPMEAAVGGIGGAENRVRNYSIVTIGWAIANFIGPIAAGFAIDYLGHLSSFALLAAFALSPLPILWLGPRLLPSMVKHKEKGPHRGGVAELWRQESLRNTIVAGGCVGSAKDLFQFYLPIYGHAVGLSASAIGTVLGMMSAATVVIRAIIPFVAKRLTEAQILTSAVLLAACAFALMPLFTNAYALAVVAFMIGLGVGCAEPVMLSLFYAITPAGRIAETLGLHKTVRNATHLAVPIAFGSVGSAFGFTTVFLANAALLTFSGYLTSKVGVPKTTARRRLGAKD